MITLYHTVSYYVIFVYTLHLTSDAPFHSMFSSSFEVLVGLLKATEASIHLGALLSEGIFQASLHPILCLAKGSWQPWRRSLSFRDCLNVLKGNQTKVCKSLQIGSKEVLKTIGMQTHGEKKTCSTVQPCFNTHGKGVLGGLASAPSMLTIRGRRLALMSRQSGSIAPIGPRGAMCPGMGDGDQPRGGSCAGYLRTAHINANSLKRMWHILLVKGGELQFNPEIRQDSRVNEQAYEVP